MTLTGRTCFPISSRHDGYYDKTGHWQRTKFCFVSCGDRCTCKPPFGRYYSEAHDQRKHPPKEENDGSAPSEIV